MTDLIYSVVIAVLGFVIGYLLKRPEAKEFVERIKVERVDVPRIVEKLVETVRVEYVEKPVLVETVKVERVDVPYVVEKPVPQIERVAVPMSPKAASMAAEPRAHLVFMDAGEQKTKFTETVDARLRRPTLLRGDAKYSCTRQADNGDWIYRQVAH